MISTFYRLLYFHFHKSQLSKSNFCVMCPVSSSHRRWLLRQRYICALVRVSWHSHYTLFSYISMKTICCFKWLLCLYIVFMCCVELSIFKFKFKFKFKLYRLDFLTWMSNYVADNVFRRIMGYRKLCNASGMFMKTGQFWCTNKYILLFLMLLIRSN